jgi:signal transduction histidine kinase
MPLSPKGKIRSGYLIAFLLLLISYILIFYTINRLQRESDLITHTYTVIHKLESLKSEIVDAETGLRGYIITSEATFLPPYESGTSSIPVTFNELQELVAENPAQLQKLKTLDWLIKTRLDYMSRGLRSFQENHFRVTDEMRAEREAARLTMDSIRLYVAQMKGTEEKLMKDRKSKLSTFFSSTHTITIVSLITAFLAILYSLLVYNNENEAREKADEKTRRYRKELEDKISELSNMNTELQELRSQEKFASTGRIARTIAHEVRNPLTNISLASEQLQDLTKQNEDAGVLLSMISRNAGRINQLVSELLNATRFSQLETARFRIDKILDESLEMARDRIDLSQIKVEKHYSEDAEEVMVDREKIRLAFLNIIVNAIEAMEKNKGVLQLRTRKQGDKYVIEIRDNGKGMDKDTLHKLFEPYFTAKSAGNGLGLTNTQNIILNHRGKIKVESQPGKGSVFFIYLDIAN